MLDQSAVGLKVSQDFCYTQRDIMLYNLSVGAEMEDLDFIYEKRLKTIPTFCVIPCVATFGTIPYSDHPLSPTSLIPGLRTDGSLHMDHELRIFHPIKTEDRWQIEKKITGVYDRGAGRGAKIDMEISARDKEGRVLFTNTMGYLNRWAENCGGKQSRRASLIPEREHDLLLTGRFSDIAPALYRLCGDTLPIHVDPESAKAAGLPGPVVHGLCSLGHACRLLVRELFPGEPERMTSIYARFSSMVFPGNSYALYIWHITENMAAFRMVSQDNNTIILNDGSIGWSAVPEGGIA